MCSGFTKESTFFEYLWKIFPCTIELLICPLSNNNWRHSHPIGLFMTAIAVEKTIVTWLLSFLVVFETHSIYFFFFCKFGITTSYSSEVNKSTEARKTQQ